MTQTTHREFTTTSARGLRHDILPMRLYHKAKKLGVWDPRSIDFSQDILDWQNCTPEEQEDLLHLTALFQAGEEGVTLDLLPLMLTIAQEGRVEEEMFLTTFLWEEAKHTEFFRRFLDEVTHAQCDLHHYHLPNYRKLIYEELPQSMFALLNDRSPAAQARASVTYNMIIEGVLAETGYYAYYNMLERSNMLPGLKEGLGYLKRDESRHIAYGIFLISRLVAQDETLWPVVEQRMNELLVIALGVVSELYADPTNLDAPQSAFGMRLQNDLDYAMNQYNKRVERIKRARGQSLEELYHVAEVEEQV